jgi:hypothetical protein
VRPPRMVWQRCGILIPVFGVVVIVVIVGQLGSCGVFVISFKVVGFWLFDSRSWVFWLFDSRSWV